MSKGLADVRKDLDQYLTDWRGVDAWVLQIGACHHFQRPIPINYIFSRQRALGLRSIKHSTRKKT